MKSSSFLPRREKGAHAGAPWKRRPARVKTNRHQAPEIGAQHHEVRKDNRPRRPRGDGPNGGHGGLLGLGDWAVKNEARTEAYGSGQTYTAKSTKAFLDTPGTDVECKKSATTLKQTSANKGVGEPLPGEVTALSFEECKTHKFVLQRQLHGEIKEHTLQRITADSWPER